MVIKKGVLIGVCCVALAVFAVLVGFILKDGSALSDTKQMTVYSYQREFGDLAESLDAINTALEKSLYVSSPYQAVTLASTVWKEAGEAERSLNVLPIYELHLDTITKYLNQTGEYVLALAKDVVNGREVTDEQRQTMLHLSKQAAELSRQMTELQYTVNTENKGYDDFLKFIQNDDRKSLSDDGGSGGQAVNAMAGTGDGNVGDDAEGSVGSEFVSENPLINMESALDLPELNYNGPFSEHLNKKQSVFLLDKDAISEKEAKNRAAYVLGCNLSDLEPDNDYIIGDVKCYGFQGKNMSINVTMLQGYPMYFSKNRDVKDATISDDKAIELGLAFLKKMKFANMEPTYAYSAGNILTVDYIFVYKDVKFVTDKIRLSIALDNGDIIAMDAHDYLFAHNADRKITPSISSEEALEKVNSAHEVTGVSLAYIASQSYDEPEKLCYEVECKSNERTMLIYINAVSGVEEDIKLIHEDENGQYLM